MRLSSCPATHSGLLFHLVPLGRAIVSTGSRLHSHAEQQHPPPHGTLLVRLCTCVCLCMCVLYAWPSFSHTSFAHTFRFTCRLSCQQYMFKLVSSVSQLVRKAGVRVAISLLMIAVWLAAHIITNVSHTPALLLLTLHAHPPATSLTSCHFLFFSLSLSLSSLSFRCSVPKSHRRQSVVRQH